MLKGGDISDNAMGVLGKIPTALQSAMNMFDPEKSKGTYRDLEDSVGQIAQLFTNVPVKNLMRDTRAMFNFFSGKPYADRETNKNVIKYQTVESLANADNLLGLVNKYLGEAGYKSTNAAYYRSMFDAMQSGNEEEAQGIREYLTLGKGVTDSAIETGLKKEAKKNLEPAEASQWQIDNGLMNGTGTITTQFKDGEITETEATKLMKEVNPDLTDDDIYWKLDAIKYEQETGEKVSGKYYRLKDAMGGNTVNGIQSAVKELLGHGATKENIKTQLTKDWKKNYLEADLDGKRKIRNAVTIAYKAMGYTATDAEKIIKNWK